MRSVDRLERAVTGAVLTAQSPGFDAARRIFNAGARAAPAVIVLCADETDVQHALAFAAQEQLPVSVRAGGHSVGGHCLVENGVVIDLRRLNRISVDLPTRTVTVGAGCLWSDVLAKLGSEYGVPGAFDPRVGVAGLTLGGGYGMLSRLHGLAADNLLGADVVLADGSRVSTHRDEEPELFWAIRGAGANFGVATSLRFAMHPLQPLWTVRVSSPLSQLRDLLFTFGHLSSSLPDEATVYLGIGERVELQGFFFGHPSAGEDLIAELGPEAVLTELAPREYPLAHVANTDTFPEGHQHSWRSHFFSQMTQQMVEKISTHVSGYPSWMVLEHLGGAMGRVAPNATAFAHRTAKFGFVSALKWPHDARRPAHAVRVQQRLHDALKPDSLGSYVNYLDQPDAAAGYGANLPRLRKAKLRFDPTNVFRHNINIKPESR